MAEVNTLTLEVAQKPLETITALIQDNSGDSETEAKLFIYNKESNNSPCKINGGAIDCNYNGDRACGIGQSLPCQKLTAVCNLSDYDCQDKWFTNYAVNRYGSWAKAIQFWSINKWW